MSELLPAADDLSDDEIYAFLHHAGKTDERALNSLFAAPSFELAARLETLAETSPEALADIAAYHGVYELPYAPSKLFPDMDVTTLPEAVDNPEKYVDDYLSSGVKQQHDESVGPLKPGRSGAKERTYLIDEVARLAHPDSIDPEDWAQYQAVHAQWHTPGGFCNLRNLIYANLWSAHAPRDIQPTERYYFEHHLPPQYKTSLWQWTPRDVYDAQVPLYDGLRLDASRLTRSIGLISELIAADPWLDRASATAYEEHAELIERRMFRAQDPHGARQATKRAISESINRAVVPSLVEGSRLDPGASIDDADLLPRLTLQEVPAMSARLSPLGYIGPALVHGVGLEGAVMTANRGKLRYTPESISHLDDMRRYVNRHFHYEKLKAQVEKGGDMTRTGTLCPVRLTPEDAGLDSNAITILSEVVFMYYDLLGRVNVESRQRPTFNADTPYRPDQIQPRVEKLYEAHERYFDAVKPDSYRALGRQAAQLALAP